MKNIFKSNNSGKKVLNDIFCQFVAVVQFEKDRAKPKSLASLYSENFWLKVRKDFAQAKELPFFQMDKRIRIKNKKSTSKKYNLATNFAIILFFFLLQFIIFTKPTFAAPYGFAIDPPVVRIQIKPGKAITQVFTVSNLNPDDKIFIARIVPFTESDSLGNPKINLRSQAGWQNFFTLANSDIKLDQPFTVRGGSTEQLILSISIPDTASLQDIYATLLISSYSNTINVGYQGSVVSATIGSNILVTICSDLNPSTILKIENFVPTSEILFKIGNTYFADNISPIMFSGQVKNDGSFTAETKGVFKISTKNDSPVYLDGILPVYAISKNNRNLINTQGNTFTYLPSISQIGYYKASLEIKTDNSNTSSSLDIIFLPIKATIGLLFSLFILSTVIRVTRKPKNQIDTSIDV